MMAYENNKMNNAPFADATFNSFEPNQLDGKLDTSCNLPMGGGLPAFLQQFNNCSTQQQQMNNLANLQMQMNARSNGFNNNLNNCMNNMQPTPMTMNNFPQTTLMNSMAMQQPFFQASFQQQQQQQQPRGIPNFISFNIDASANCNPTKPFLASYEPTVSSADVQKHLFANCNLEPVPMKEKAVVDLPKSCNNISEHTQTTTSSSLPPRTSISKSKRLLPADFEPCGNYVICGNKRKYFESKGNIRFREVCKLFLQEYVQAPTKIEKSAVVTKVMNILRKDCPEGAFVSPQGGRWYAVSERTAREKVGTYFRDCLSDSYKSSAKNKIARRKIIKKAGAASANNSESNFSDDASLESISFYDVDDLTPVPL